MEKIKTIKGGEFLIKETTHEAIFIPESISEEQKMIVETCRDFLEKEIYPNLDRIDDLEENLLSSLLEKAGELGLLGISLPEKFGGFGQDMITSMLSTIAIGGSGSFAVAYAAHTGIGTLPTLYYGNQQQKEKYVPKLASGEWKGAYALSEPEAGSDANSGKSRAKLSDDGKYYILNGQKIWITNGGFADIFTVFAKIEDDDNLSAFIIERNFEGITFSPEEKKLGIKGSSTCQMFFENCKIPVENLLGKRGEGFKIALNILNNGRIKLAGAVIGAAKMAITDSVGYANERVQFGNTISTYGAIKYKLAEQAIRIYACEAAVFRCVQDVQNTMLYFVEEGMEKDQALINAQKEFAAEAAILKVFGSEALDYVVDEGVQIYGGMGYSAEYLMERRYRDSRINRIFEGTNEINRMLVVDYLMRKAMKGELQLMSAAKKVAGELISIPDFGEEDTQLFAREKNLVANFKKIVLMIAGAAAQKFMQKLAEEQELLMNISNIIMDCYVAESLLFRVMKLVDLRGEDKCREQIHMLEIFLYDATDRISKNGKDAINSFAAGDELRMMLLGMKRFTRHPGLNVKEARRAIANSMIEENKYCF